MKKLVLILAVVFSTNFLKAQCPTNQYIGLANRVFDLEITSSDFYAKEFFITFDTINAHDFTVPSVYSVHSSPEPVIKAFSKFIKSMKWEGGFYNYWELINHPLYNSPLHQSFLLNDDKNTYKIDIWNSKEDISKIEGLTVVKYDDKFKKTPY